MYFVLWFFIFWKGFSHCFYRWWWWWWWIVFVVWMTNERRLAIFPAGTIVRDLHHFESPTWTCPEPEFRLCWMKLCSSDKHYTTVPQIWVRVLVCCWGVCYYYAFVQIFVNLLIFEPVYSLSNSIFGSNLCWFGFLFPMH